MSNIYGTVGYAFLEDQNIENICKSNMLCFKNSYLIPWTERKKMLTTIYEQKPKYILILADIHSKLPYCENQINITDWFFKNINNTNILLEEVIRDDNIKLKELWGTSEHTINLKNFFLNNPEIVHAIDFRPSLIPYSWEHSSISNNSISLSEYVLLLKKFFNFEGKFLQYKNLLETVKIEIIKIHFDIIKKIYKDFLQKYNDYMNHYILQLIKDNKEILEEINEILDNIMEWYTIAKMFSINNNKNIIIHTGLYHSNKIITCLTHFYNYKINNSDGINKIDDLENKEIISGCINLPKFIENQLFLIT